jgi:predicted tellurium resistance membrane protein TerC
MNLFTVENAISLLSLSAMEIVLGIDNIVFIAILAQKVPRDQRSKVRRIGLVLALGMRLGLLATLSFVMSLTAPLFSVIGQEISGRDLVLLLGGLFLLGKSTHEIYEKLEVDQTEEEASASSSRGKVASVLIQIMVLDIVFSLDSVITAVGMAKELEIMVAAMIIAVVVMLIFADGISEFINRHPSMKILALSFLLLIGSLLVAEAFDKHVQKGYIYFAMAFALLIELLNMRFRKKQRAVSLHHRFEGQPAPGETDGGQKASGAT